MLLPASWSVADPLTVSYMERPPYYYTQEMQPAGFLYERTRAILGQAGIEARFVSLNPRQIFYVVQHSIDPHCSIGWFKTSQREIFARFTDPIYRNRPLVALVKSNLKDQVAALQTLRQFFADQDLTLGRIRSFSYGSYVDGLLEKMNPPSHFHAERQAQLLESLEVGDADYVLVAPEEASTLMSENGFRNGQFFIKQLSDVPAGNLRYLMCSQATGSELIERINRAIHQLYPDIQ